MTDQTTGATYADAIIAALRFAREEPLTFLLTVPGSIALCIGGSIWVMKLLVVGPTSKLRAAFDAKRAASAALSYFRSKE
jgi:hypothetical protein